MLTDKYKSVLGEVQLSSKIADLGARGVTYGPLLAHLAPGKKPWICARKSRALVATRRASSPTRLTKHLKADAGACSAHYM